MQHSLIDSDCESCTVTHYQFSVLIESGKKFKIQYIVLFSTYILISLVLQLPGQCGGRRVKCRDLDVYPSSSASEWMRRASYGHMYVKAQGLFSCLWSHFSFLAILSKCFFFFFSFFQGREQVATIFRGEEFHLESWCMCSIPKLVS